MFQSLYQMRCDTNTIRFISLIIVLTIILCLIDWMKYGDNAKHHSTGNKFNRDGKSDKKAYSSHYHQTFCDLDR